MLSSIRLQHYRSYDDDSFEFTPGVNIIVGPNASGKTNLLEAILVASRGSSYRAHYADLVHFDHDWARIDVSGADTVRTVKLLRASTTDKTFEIGGRVLKRLSLEQSLPVVLFEPNHLLLLTGSPERRRDYLDELLAQLVVGYGSTLRAYRRALAQRNRLLKSDSATSDHLFPWDLRLSELAGTLVRHRLYLVGSINKIIGDLYRDLSHTPEQVSVAYPIPGTPDQYESHMLHQLEARVQTDRLRGFTSFGPHRDDLRVVFGGRPAEEVASRGETRTFVLALKIVELRLLEEKRDKTPLLLLDDVFSELDGSRRQALTTHLQSYQTFITTTDADVVVHHFTDRSNILLISGRTAH